MIKIAVVEDDERYVSKLLQYLETYKKEEKEDFLIKVYRDGCDIVTNYKAQYHIILMDIQMKFVDGMTAAEEIRKKDSDVIIIFITNIPQYAIRGYEVGALDYILKPVSYFVLHKKLKRAIVRLQKTNQQYIIIPVKGGIKREYTSNIYYIESKGHNLIYHTKNGIYLSNGTLKNVEELLTQTHFSRGNNRYLINLEHVEAIENNCAIVKGEHLLLSRTRRNSFMQKLTNYWGKV